MRGLGWIIAAVGIVLVLVATGVIGDSDRGDETVPAGEWVQDVCAAVGVWRGEVEAITESFRLATQTSDSTEMSAPTAEAKVDTAQIALERSIEAADTLIEAIDRAGTPDTPDGEQVAEQISNWANGAHNDLDEAEKTLDEEPDTLEEDVELATSAARSIATALESGRQTIAVVGTSDPALQAAFQQSSTCQQLREETG